MNPFDLRGPEFLAFYTALGAGALAVLWITQRSLESTPAGAQLLGDYLEIAYLRGGPGEAVRVATMNLIVRGLLQIVDEDHLQAVEAEAPAFAGKRLEQLIVTKCQSVTSASSVLADAALREAATEECAPPLVRRGLLPDDRAVARRRSMLAAAAFVLTAVAGTKVLVALSRGRSNIAFLIIEAIAFLFLCYKLTNALRTADGDAQLVSLMSLFAGLRERARSVVPGSASYDFALLAAVFGADVIPPRFGLATLFPKARSSSSCGSSCGGVSGSGGSSCGSSCGGGGGGGCGGCGGS